MPKRADDATSPSGVSPAVPQGRCGLPAGAIGPVARQLGAWGPEKLPSHAASRQPVPACASLCRPIAAATGPCQLLPFAAKCVLPQVTAGLGVRPFCVLSFTIFHFQPGRQIPNPKIQAPNKSQIPSGKFQTGKQQKQTTSPWRLGFGLWSLELFRVFGTCILELGICFSMGAYVVPPPLLVVTRFAQRISGRWAERAGLRRGPAGRRLFSDFRATLEARLPVWAREVVAQVFNLCRWFWRAGRSTGFQPVPLVWARDSVRLL